MLMIPETRRTEASLGNLLCYAYRRRVADFEECLAKFVAEGGFNLNALNDVAWRLYRALAADKDKIEKERRVAWAKYNTLKRQLQRLGARPTA